MTNDLAAERWTKLTLNVMGNGVSACTGQKSRDSIADDRIRQFMARLGSECIRVGQKLGHKLEEMYHLDPEIIARAGEGDAEAKRIYDAEPARLDQEARRRRASPVDGPGHGEGPPHRDRVHERACGREGQGARHPDAGECGADDIVKKVERGELTPDKSNITGLRESC